VLRGVPALPRNVKRLRGGLVFEAHRLVSLNSRLESNKEEEEPVLSLEAHPEEAFLDNQKGLKAKSSVFVKHILEDSRGSVTKTCGIPYVSGPYRDGPASGEIISHLCRLGIFGHEE